MLAVLTLVAAMAADPGEMPGAPGVEPAHVRDVLAAKCSQCHGPQLPHPKGKFGFITDLRRLGADANYVVPGDPGGSYLWNQIDDGEMPPKKAKAGPLTDQEKADIEEWIKAGAPAPVGEPERPPPAPPAPPRPTLERIGAFVGRFH